MPPLSSPRFALAAASKAGDVWIGERAVLTVVGDDAQSIYSFRAAVLARAEQGYEVDQIANDIGMTRQNAEHSAIR